MSDEWQDISTLGKGETVVRLKCDDGSERTGWRYDDEYLEVAGTGSMLLDASKRKPDGVAVYATHWLPSPPSQEGTT